MSVTAQDFAEQAAALLESTSEIDWRSATSRAYYAAYHKGHEAVDLCPDNAHLSMGSHERLSGRFELHDSKGAKSIAVVLKSMKRHRHMADYEIEDPFEKSLATNQVAQYKAFAERIVSFENSFRKKTA